jgi:hypothetical protein
LAEELSVKPKSDEPTARMKGWYLETLMEPLKDLPLLVHPRNWHSAAMSVWLWDSCWAETMGSLLWVFELGSRPNMHLY